MTKVVQIAPEIAVGSGVGGVAHALEQAFQAAGVETSRFTLADARGGWLPEPGPGLRGKLVLLARVVWFSTVGTVLARRNLARDPDALAICHNDVLAGDIYINHGILRAAMKARGHYALRMVRNPVHVFTAVRDAVRFGGRTHRVVVSLTSGESALLASTYPRIRPRRVVISNGVDVERFRPATPAERIEARRRLAPAIPADALCLAFVGHEFARKGLGIAIEALAAAPAAHLLVAGGTQQMIAEQRETAERWGVGDRVHFVGRLADARPAFYAADALVLPSAYEANALVVLEAMAAGIPVVATPVGYVPDLVVDASNGFVIERTAGAVADAIERLRAADRAELGRQARRSAEAHSWSRIADRYLALLADLADERPRS